jgi:TPR repeat protein
MKANFWALIFSLFLAVTTKAQQPAFPPATNSLTTNTFLDIAQLRAKAEKGDAAAQFDLGSCYYYGDGVPQDLAEAVKWSRKAAEQGHVEAQFNLAVCYEHGQGVAQDFTEAVRWYRKSAEQGMAAAQGNLGFCYVNGQGVPRDYGEAVKWYRKAAEKGAAAAQYGLGLCYHDGQGVPQDYAEAVKWYRKAADQGNAPAQYNLGTCYSKGQGVTQDYTEAVKWVRKSAEQGEPLAQYYLGTLYDAGQGVPKDYAEAVKWLRKSAEQGNAWGQCIFGLNYAGGLGVPKDYVEAYKWYNLAAAQNEVIATAAIDGRDFVAKSMSPSQIAEGQRLSREFVARKEGGALNRADVQEADAVRNLPRATGTGFFVTDDGYLVTCYHVVQEADRIAVRTKVGTFAAMLVKADKVNDVTVLKVTGTFSPLPVASSRGVKLGESAFTIGFPNTELQGFAPKLTKGEISSLTGVQDDPREFQISVTVQPGNSGGPLVNQYGNVVGIVAAQLADIATLETTGSLPQNVNYAVKSSVLNVLLESLPDISPKLLESNPSKDRKFEDVEKEAESAVALVLVY